MNMTDPLEFAGRELDELRTQGLFREPRLIEAVSGTRVRIEGRELVNFGSNDYLGLAGHPAVREAAQKAMEEWGVGAGAARLVTGNLAVHEALERRVAAFKETEAAILFGSGYTANLGTISALVGRDDLILSDRLNHASLIDGCRLSRARLRVYRHRDLESLEEQLKKSQGFRRRLVVTDSVFSVDGDLAPLAEIADLADRYGAMLMVDEAHSTGVFGDRGSGLAHRLGVAGRVQVHMGTLSKAVGVIGGYVAGDRTLIDYLRNRARSFIFTTAIPAACCSAAMAAIEIIEQQPEVRERLWANVEQARTALAELHCDMGDSASQIIPVIIGDAREAMDVSLRLSQAGFLAPALRPPTVPEGSSRLRVSISAGQSSNDISSFAGALSQVLAGG